MKTLDSGFRLLAVSLACCILTAASGARAQENPSFDTGWSLRFYAASIDFNNSRSRSDFTHHDYDLDIGFGLGLNAEYRFSRRLGLDVGILGGAALEVAWTPAVDDRWVWTAYDTLAFSPLTAGLDVHLVPDNDVDLYIRPMLTWTHYGGIIVHSAPSWASTEVEFEEDVGVALALGLGVPIGDRKRWSFAASAAHFASNLDSRSPIAHHLSGDYDATILGIGFGYRF